ncbi:hypothetical protein HME9302_01290 [Alteripontixanthobacter maritimus]|uniref:Lipoprotein n=1 Tax=Alteripontixanthobacter maritimus TaxID=2161824 RepID=A0A369Q5C2_9SPHN|nr:hypothetical protein [Alteripontixanthobacter maritimus]RDC60091.1 hypothetical protein HME9302_01290 [Alteripontixanthobacter maritimus]
MRGFASVALALTLVACSQSETEQAREADAERVAALERIECAIGEGSQFAAICTIEEVASDDGAQVVVRHPDGGLRRFDRLPDGKGLAAADGADTAAQSYADGMLEIAIDGDRYRFPARAKSADPAAGNGGA